MLGDGDRGEVWVMDADGGNPVVLTSNTVPEGGASLSPDGSQVLFLSGSNERFEIYYNDNLFVMPSGGGAARDLTKDFGYEITDAAWSKDGRAIYVIANMGVHSQLLRDPRRRRHAQGPDQRQPRDRRLDLRAVARPSRLHQGRPGQRAATSSR